MFGNDDTTQDTQNQDNQQVASAPTSEPVNDASLGDQITQTFAPSDDTTNLDVASTLSDTPIGTQATGGEDLLGIKQQALQDLSPLVTHLDQTPEEKFHTLMMMIQATDNQALVKDAYTAAKQITDDKVRAQALLDVINEINYFTQATSK